MQLKNSNNDQTKQNGIARNVNKLFEFVQIKWDRRCNIVDALKMRNI